MHPVLFSLDSLTVYSYGFFVALAVVLVFVIGEKRAILLGIPQSVAVDLIFLLFVAGVIGARLFFVMQHFRDYQDNMWKIFSLQEGGLVWYGGFLTAASAGFLYARWRKWSVLKLCDFFAPLLPLAQAVGRAGCFLNGCCYGVVTRLPFGVLFPDESATRHPTQLYETFFLTGLSFFLFWRSGKSRFEGALFIYYLLFYSAFRFGVEFLRGDQERSVFLTIPQWMSVVLFGGALFLYVSMRRRLGRRR
jgi:phosphatidylglycerol:prolipoprotein diacylglycerol transferase